MLMAFTKHNDNLHSKQFFYNKVGSSFSVYCQGTYYYALKLKLEIKDKMLASVI